MTDDFRPHQNVRFKQTTSSGVRQWRRGVVFKVVDGKVWIATGSTWGTTAIRDPEDVRLDD